MKATERKTVERTGLMSHAKHCQKARGRRIGTKKIPEGRIEREGPRTVRSQLQGVQK